MQSLEQKTTPDMDIDKILVGIPDLTLMRLERDTLVSDLRTLKSNLISLTGHRRDTRERQKPTQDNSQILNAVSPETEEPSNDFTAEQQPSTIEEEPPDELKTSVVEKSPSPPVTKPHFKVPSVLVQPDSWRSSHLVKLDEEQRQAVLESQRSDKQTFSRNKRMFGMLMGTLQRFKTEESDRQQITRKRSKIEEKLEIAVEEERAAVTKEVTRITKLKQSKEDLLDKLELKIDLVERFKNWDRSHRHLSPYIRTESKPRIYWLPKEHVPDTERKQKETKDYWSICYAEKKAKFNKDMEEVEKSIKEHSRLHSNLMDTNNTTDC